MLSIPGCVRGPHSSVAKPAPEKKPPQPIDVRFKEIDGKKEVYATTSANIGARPAPATTPAEPKPAPAVEKPDAPDAVIPVGAPCLHKGCKSKFVGDASRAEPCTFHPGMSVSFTV
jgi:hypothetical protein